MKQIESRLAKLEQKDAPCGLKLIPAEDDETDSEAIQRAGYQQGAPGVQFIIVRRLDELI